MTAATGIADFQAHALAHEGQTRHRTLAAILHQWTGSVLSLPEERRQEAWTRFVDAMRSADAPAAARLPDSFDEAFAADLFVETATDADAARRPETERRHPSTLLRFPGAGRRRRASA